MLARHMRRAQLVELALYAAIALALHARGWSVAASAASVPALALATRLAIVCTMFVLAWIHRAPRAPAERIGLAGTAAMVLREYGAFLALNFVRTPWERQVLRPDAPGDAPGELPVVLVHGYFANRGCWKPLVHALERAGVGPVYAPNCPAHLATLERFEQELNAAIDRIARGRRVALVAHSMGGLAVRLYLARRGPGRISRIVTIGSPHHGTRLAPWGVGANAREMVPGSDFLRALEASERDPSSVPVVSLYSVHDNMILPQDSSRLAWARNIPVGGLGHVSQFGDARIARLVIEALRG